VFLRRIIHASPSTVAQHLARRIRLTVELEILVGSGARSTAPRSLHEDLEMLAVALPSRRLTTRSTH
jgi:hypothetical protein